MSRALTASIQLVVAALLLGPSLVLGTMWSHSSPQNLTWATQFADQLRAGILYPRALPDSFDHLGGPAFYFYPPLAFWVDGLLSAVTLDAFSTSYRLSLASLLLLWASGLSMQSWLEAHGISPRAAFYGALAYMAAPYHLVDHYYRGAYAEFAAYVVLPLVALSIHRIATSRRDGVGMLAIAYAMLPMAHLPTSLLISLTAVPIYVLYLGHRLGTARAAMGFFLRCVVGGTLGLGIAAIYLIPALTLQDWIPVDDFWAGGYRIENSFLIVLARQNGLVEMMKVIAFSAGAYGILAIGVLAVLASGGSRIGWRSEAACWTFICLLSLLFVVGAVPWFWQIPSVSKVQFSWRLMIVVEFAAITALCLAPWTAQPRALACVFVATLIVLAPALSEMIDGIQLRINVSRAQRETPADLKQFLPAGYPQKPHGGYAELSLGPVEGLPLISCAPEPLLCRATNLPFGDVSIELDTQSPTTVVLRRFAYPYWRLDPALAVAATDPLRLVMFTVPPGRSFYRLHHLVVTEEKIGWAISAVSLALLAGWAALVRRRIKAA